MRKAGSGWITGMRAALAIALCLFLIPSRTPALAQSEPPPEPLERGITRVAPEREPVILETRPEGAEGTATILLIPAQADAYVASERENQTFGADALFLGYNFFGDGYGAERILIRFDLGAIPDNAVINNAWIRLRLTFSSPSEDAAMNAALRRATADWSEFSVTWNNQPSVGAIHDQTGVGSEAQWYEWEVGSLVSGWLDGAFPNYGVAIFGDETVQNRERAFYARETQSQYYPQLIVDYTQVADNSPPNVTVDPLADYSRRNFDVSWSGGDVGSSGIDHYDVQYRMDDGEWVNWLSDVPFTETEFPDGLNGRLYEFRARGVDLAGNVEPFGGVEASTTVDSLPPVTEVEALPDVIVTNEIVVRWEGDDRGGSGIVYYDVRVRFNGGNWEWWIQTTTLTSAIYSASRGDGLYEFEARAVDRIGHVEPFMSTPEALTVVDMEPPFLMARIFLPRTENRWEAAR